MSLRQNINIEIKQMPNDVYPSGRNKTWLLDFVINGEINSSWQNLTDTAKISIPRNIFAEDENGKLVDFFGKDITASSGSGIPLFMRGDRVSISVGIFYDNMNGTERLEMPSAPQFEGYISKIKNRIPIEIECEDEMWKLKQINVANKLFQGYTVKKMIQEMLAGTEYTVTDGGTDVTIGDFRTQNETVAQVLERLRRDGNLYAYFRGKELRCSGIVYYPADLQTQEVFEFQNNIISDTLEYTRKEDLNVAVKAYSSTTEQKSGFNEDGTPKTGKKRIEVLYGKNGEIGDPASFHGDLITIPIIGARTKEELIKAAKAYLPKLYYTGFRGDITTYGQPTVIHGNAAIIRDKKLPERSGTYLIKSVRTYFGNNGFRQKLMLHLRIDQGFTQDQLNAGI